MKGRQRRRYTPSVQPCFHVHVLSFPRSEVFFSQFIDGFAIQFVLEKGVGGIALRGLIGVSVGGIYVRCRRGLRSLVGLC